MKRGETMNKLIKNAWKFRARCMVWIKKLIDHQAMDLRGCADHYLKPSFPNCPGRKGAERSGHFNIVCSQRKGK